MEYNFSKNTYSKTVKEDSKDRIDIEIGDIKQDDFKPQFKLMRWNNEINFSMRAEEKPNATVKQEDDTIKYITDDYEVHQYDKDVDEDGGFEFEWVLKKKPKSNVLNTTIQHKGLNFAYQDELTQKEIEDGCSRPDNIVGSYAVYHKTKQGNYTGGKHYKTGKAFHIYRPEAIDSKGEKVWCDLDINKDKLTVTVPQKFLDTASYPVTVDPTFGYTSVGGSSTGMLDDWRLSTNIGSPDDDGSVDSISVYLDPYTTSDKVNCAIYSGVGGTSKITETEEKTNMSSTTWYAFTVDASANIFSNTTYCVGAWLSSLGGVDTYYDTGSSGDGQEEFASYSTTWPSSISGDPDNDHKMSIYATYTTAGADYTLTADKGAFTLTGKDTGLEVGRKLSTSVGEFTLTGIAAAFQFTRKIATSGGEFTLTGIATGITAGRKLTSQTVSFALTGQDIAFSFARRLVSEVGTFILEGKAVQLIYNNLHNYVLTAETVAFTLTGIDTLFKASRKLALQTQSFILTGNTTLVTVTRKIAGAVGEFIMTGNDNAFKIARKFTATVTTFTLTGINASIRKRVRSGLIIFGISL